MKSAQLINKFLGLFGIGIHRVKKSGFRHHIPRHEVWLAQKNIATVIDIGANTGQFAKEISMIFPEATILSIEVIPETYQILQKNLGSKKRHKTYLAALGAETGEKHFYINDFSQSSSFLEMTDLHKKSFPHTENSIEKKFNIITLDELLANESLRKPVMLKLDVQGFEKEVLAGSKNILCQCDLLKVELSFAELYKGQALFDEMYTLLQSAGFDLIGFTHLLNNPEDGRPLQVDGFFERRTSSRNE